jgi:hypothetical protein
MEHRSGQHSWELEGGGSSHDEQQKQPFRGMEEGMWMRDVVEGIRMGSNILRFLRLIQPDKFVVIGQGKT